MTVVLCSKASADLSVQDMLCQICESFCAEENREYFENIVSSRNTESAKESLCALSLLSTAIAMLPCRIDKSKLIFKRHTEGKPYFEGNELHFNISHSKGYVACAVSDDGRVGIDIEAANISFEKAKKLAKRFFSSSDFEKVVKSPNIFNRVWSEKEAIAKFFGIALADFLKNEKKNLENKELNTESTDFVIHRFACMDIPISLCTQRKSSTISFKNIT